MFIVLDVEQAEQDLTAGRLTCPSCAGTLRPWSWAPSRLVRQRDGTTRPVRPRRARCARCHATRVLLPASCQPRLADATEVVGAALAAKAAGLGYRRIAAQLARSPSTVRRWLRRARATCTSPGCTPAGWRASTSSTPRSSPPGCTTTHPPRRRPAGPRRRGGRLPTPGRPARRRLGAHRRVHHRTTPRTRPVRLIN